MTHNEYKHMTICEMTEDSGVFSGENGLRYPNVTVDWKDSEKSNFGRMKVWSRSVVLRKIQ